MNQDKYSEKRKTKQMKEIAEIVLEFLLISIAAAVLYLIFVSDKTSYTSEKYVVCSGDTLDGLYYRYGGGNLERWRYKMKKANGMETSGLIAGEEIVLLSAE